METNSYRGKNMVLKGIRVIELAGLAPAPFCGMVLAEFGASVIRVDKVNNAVDIDCLANGKKSIALDVKHPKGAKIFRDLCRTADVLIEPFRKGVMEKLGLGPDILLADNTRLIYARLTGFGQSGSYSKKAGHDLNYVATTGLLSLLGRKQEKPFPPLNLLADFGGGGLMCALGIVMALYERTISGKGQVIDANMVDGTAYLGSWVYRSQHLPVWGKPKGENVLDSGSHWYETYETKDGKYMAVAALEHQFYDQLLKGLGLTEAECPQFGDTSNLKQILKEKFLQKSQKEWCNIFDDLDACVTPVLSVDDAAQHSHNIDRETFVKCVDSGSLAPVPAPRLLRTPAASLLSKPKPNIGQHTREVLASLSYGEDTIKKLEQAGIVGCFSEQSKL